jgi:hypothetical protein
MTTPRLTAGRCQCGACGLRFSSVREFDRHRTGAYAEPGEWQGSRRCWALAELIARGWRTDPRGHWMQGRPQPAPVEVSGERGMGGATQVASAPQ